MIVFISVILVIYHRESHTMLDFLKLSPPISPYFHKSSPFYKTYQRRPENFYFTKNLSIPMSNTELKIQILEEILDNIKIYKNNEKGYYTPDEILKEVCSETINYWDKCWPKFTNWSKWSKY